MTTDRFGAKTYYLLTDVNGNGVTGEALRDLLPFVADPVTITGDIVRRGTLLELRFDRHQIERVE